MENKKLIKLKDGGVLNISDSTYCYFEDKSTEVTFTGEYEFVRTVNLELTKYTINVNAEAKDICPLTLSEFMLFILNRLEDFKSMTEEEFCSCIENQFSKYNVTVINKTRR